MRIAYVVSAYHHPSQLVRLVRRLDGPEASFLVHFDRKSDDRLFRQAVDGLAGMANLLFLERHDCYWGDFGHVRASLKGMRAAIEGGIPFEYLVLLTGQDYPIKPSWYIEQRLRESGGCSYLDHAPLPRADWPNGGLDRIRHWHFRWRGSYLAFPERRHFGHRLPGLAWSLLIALLPLQRRFPRPFHPFGGSSYWCLSREAVAYIHDFVEKDPGFVRFFHRVRVPDEIFFQTVVMNSPLRDRVVNDDLRHVDWARQDRGRPPILRKGDYLALERSPQLFARKFDETVDTEILDMIDDGILGRSVEGGSREGAGRAG